MVSVLAIGASRLTGGDRRPVQAMDTPISAVAEGVTSTLSGMDLSASGYLLDSETTERTAGPASSLRLRIRAAEGATVSRYGVIGNLLWDFAHITLAIPVAALGFVTPVWAAALAMAFSGVLVVPNSPRLFRLRAVG